MRFLQTIYVLAIALLFVTFTNTSEAQVPTGKWRIVGTTNNGAGFHGTVNIRKAGRVSVRLNNGFTMVGRATRNGSFTVTSVRGSGQTFRATGQVSLKNRRYATSSRFWVEGYGRGIFMMGRI